MGLGNLFRRLFVRHDITGEEKAKQAEAELKEASALVPPSAYAAALTGRLAVFGLRVLSAFVVLNIAVVAGVVAVEWAFGYVNALWPAILAFVAATFAAGTITGVVTQKLTNHLRAVIARRALASIDKAARKSLPALSHHGTVAVPSTASIGATDEA